VTSGPINAYQDYLFSMHMVGHMLLTMAIPMMLVFGAPVTLASRAIAKRDDGTRGGREWILWAVHTPFARVVTHPLFAAAMFVGSLWAFYYTDLFRWTLYDHLGHEWMVAHFLISGYLFVQSLVGIDPVPCATLPVPAAHADRCDGDARVLRHLDHDVVGAVRRRVVRLDGAHVGEPRWWTSTPGAASRGRSARSRP
jgi:hypothetical protein